MEVAPPGGASLRLDSSAPRVRAIARAGWCLRPGCHTVSLMKRFSALGLILIWLCLPLPAADAPGAAVEDQLSQLAAAERVTVVHLWAPWCSNCKAEMRPDGWAKFVRENPEVTVVFVNIWHADQDPAPKLAAGGLGGQPNFIALTHPNPARKKGESLDRLLGFPVTWVPTTWVMRAGKLRYALNYGEVRFDMLQQMVEDAGRKW